jgi:hypothetical protein
MNAIHPNYDAVVEPVRARLAGDPRIQALLSPDLDPARLHMFLMRWSGWGVQMTKPVEGWIQRAGERCSACGFADLGRALVKHAKHEAGHDQMMVDDLRWLVQAWNRQAAVPFAAEQFQDVAATPAMQRYVDLHEQIIAGSEPFAQIAIEYEIEMLSTTLGPRLLEQVLRVLGPEARQGLSFLQEHVTLDIGHTAFNRGQMTRFIAKHPQAVPALAAAGARALEAYADFLADCLQAPPPALAWNESSAAAATARV